MKPSAIQALLFLLLLLPSAASAQTRMDTTAASQSRAAEIARIEEYLTRIGSLAADFTQISPDGSLSSGKFFLKKPGRMRWQYHPPTPILIVSDGKVLTYYDYELEQVSHVPLDDSLIGFLARENIRFSNGVAIAGFEKKNDALRLELVQGDKPSEGKLLLEFSDNPLQLREMVMFDASGQITSVSLKNAEYGVPLNKDLFVFRDPRKRRKL